MSGRGVGESLPVGPGFLGFLVTFVLCVAVWFLLRNMNSRMRRMAYDERARQEQARAAAAAESGGASEATSDDDRAASLQTDALAEDVPATDSSGVLDDRSSADREGHRGEV